jgi:hypothetical protein
MKNFNLLFALIATLFIYSCGTTDIDPPTICSNLVQNGVSTFDEVEALAGTSLTLTEAFCDNEELGEVRWDIHSAEGHSHEGEEEEGFILHSGTTWSVLETQNLSGTSNVSDISFPIPNTARGVWDIVISFSDAEGNASADVITPLHVDNDFIPLFTLTDVNGTDPSTWTGEQIWEAGSTITIMGTVSDSDGIEHYGFHLENEDTEQEIAEDEGEASGVTEVPLSWTIEIPEDAEAGEYHFHMHAEDMNENHTETGFHLEIE